MLLQNFTEIEEIKIKMVDEEKAKMFLKELKSKLKTKKRGHAQYDHFRQQNKELILDKMVAQIEGIERDGAARKMPVQMYFKNAFGDTLSDALYELERNQLKFTENQDYFTVKGQIEYLAGEILEHLPEWQKDENGEVPLKPGQK